MELKDALSQTPIVAILRGLTSQEAVAVGETLVSAGIAAIEVPMNSPKPLESIQLLSQALAGRAVVGAGTVLSVEVVDDVAKAGGTLSVSPNTTATVIRRAVERGLVAVPGFATATEAFIAYEAGARLLKLFPASTYGPSHMSALRAVLPTDVTILATGGVQPEAFEEWWSVGVRSFGLGSDLYRPGFTLEQIKERARKAVEVVRGLV